MKGVDKKNTWYADGLQFQCMQCGRCCSGPGEGYIWITRPEMQIIADFLKIAPGELRHRYLKRVGLRTTIIEQQSTRDCIFLKEEGGLKECVIYPVRPNQCRTWPFWADNLSRSDLWNQAAQKCSGVGKGKLYSFEEIEGIRKSKWWMNSR